MEVKVRLNLARKRTVMSPEPRTTRPASRGARTATPTRRVGLRLAIEMTSVRRLARTRGIRPQVRKVMRIRGRALPVRNKLGTSKTLRRPRANAGMRDRMRASKPAGGTTTLRVAMARRNQPTIHPKAAATRRQQRSKPLAPDRGLKVRRTVTADPMVHRRVQVTEINRPSDLTPTPGIQTGARGNLPRRKKTAQRVSSLETQATRRPTRPLAMRTRATRMT